MNDSLDYFTILLLIFFLYFLRRHMKKYWIKEVKKLQKCDCKYTPYCMPLRQSLQYEARNDGLYESVESCVFHKAIKEKEENAIKNTEDAI